MTAGRWLIAGLGNPGPAYAANRHNAGFLTADVLAARAGARFKAGKFRTLAAEGRLAGQGVTIIKPLTFMNESGGPVTGVSGYYRLGPDQLVVIHDELDLAFGTVRLKLGGGDNGHNGLKSITKSLGADYLRVRAGIGRPPGRMDVAAFVLKDFSSNERKELDWFVDRAADAVEAMVSEGLERAQSTYNS